MVGFGDHGFDDRQVVSFGELPVALVTRGDRHDRPRAVTQGDVIGDEDRDALAVDGVDGEAPGEQARLLFVLDAVVRIGFAFRLSAVGSDRLGRGGVASGPGGVGALRPLGGSAVGQVVFGCQHHEGGAEQGVRACGEHLDLLAAGGLGEEHLGPLGTTDPVALHGLDLVGPVQLVKVRQEAFRVGGDAQHPLAHVAFEHREVANLRTSLVGDFLISQHSTQARAPVHGRIGQVSQPVRVDDSALLLR